MEEKVNHEARDSQDYVKVIFDLDPNDWETLKTEGMWAKPKGDSLYEIDNIPFYVYGVSLGDIVAAKEDERGLIFDKVNQKSGHSTFRVLLNKALTSGSRQFQETWIPLKMLGCGYEIAGPTWIAIDAPRSADLGDVRELLIKGENDQTWEWFDADASIQGKLQPARLYTKLIC